LRPDRQALRQNNTKEAAAYKKNLEDAQRKRKDDEIANRWFKPVKDQYGEFWDCSDEYWKERDARLSKYLEKHEKNAKHDGHEANRARAQLEMKF